MELRVMTYNIQIGSNSSRNPKWEIAKFDLDAIISMIHRFDPDILAIQEVDRFRSRSGYTDQVSYIAGELGMSWSYSPSYFAEETLHGRGQYGIAILSKFPIIHAIPHSLWRRAKLQRGEESWVNERRSMLEVRIDAGGVPIDVYCTHLSTTEDQRSIQIPEIRGILGHSDKPKILMGDFNTTPDTGEVGPLVDILLDVFGDTPHPPSYPNGSMADEAIDYILVGKEFKVTSAGVIIDDEGISDHNPVMADLILA